MQSRSEYTANVQGFKSASIRLATRQGTKTMHNLITRLSWFVLICIVVKFFF